MNKHTKDGGTSVPFEVISNRGILPVHKERARKRSTNRSRVLRGKPVVKPEMAYAPKGNVMNSPNSHPDFSLRDEGSLILLTPLSPSAHDFVEERIGSGNGYQPYWPTVVIERRYAQDILEGIIADGMAVQS